MLERTIPPLLGVLALGVLALGGCGSARLSGGPGGRLRVVAVEDFWGSIARQLGGSRVDVSSIVANPSADPHDYEPTGADARSLASAQLAVVNGIGYDQWATRLLDANPAGGRTVVNVGELLGLRQGDNPHQWYAPGAVRRVIDRISADYARADPADARYFRARRRHFLRSSLARYWRLIGEIRSRYAGTAIGASESVIEPLARALRLKLLTPPSFLAAVSEGTEPTPADRVAVDRQIANREIRVWVYNSQNASPDVQRLNDAARAAAIPVATVTETLSPQGASFQAWMTGELAHLRRALAGTGAARG